MVTLFRRVSLTLVDLTSSFFEDSSYLLLELCCLRRFYLLMQAGWEFELVHIPARSSQCSVVANVTSKEVRNGMPVCLVCFLLLGHSLTKELSS